MTTTTVRSQNPMTRRTATLGVAFAALCAAGIAHAVEGGSGLYALGFTAPQAGLTPPPGTYFGYNYYSYKGDAGVNVSVNRQVPVPGTGFKLPAQLNGTIRADLDLSVSIFSLTHVFKETVLGGQPGISVAIPYAKADLGVTGSGVLTLNAPGGGPGLTIPVNGRASGSNSGMGDTVLTGLLGWHSGFLHYMAVLNVYAPTGEYDQNRVVNLGRNHWGIEPMGTLTYLNEKNGIEFSAAAGITFNQRNSATDYKSGSEFHLDIAAIQHFGPAFYAGLVGYEYHQLTGDSGGGAAGDFKGRVHALGLVVGGIIPLAEKHPLFINARYYQESGAKNRTEGNTFFLTGVIPF